jgi:predicted MFS family arabinose efflux permease
MAGTAQGWLILRLTDSSTSLGLAAFVNMIPTLLLTLYAGVLADRLDRRRLLIATQLVLAVLSATLAFLATMGVIDFWQILLISLVSGAAGAMSLPAFQALLPMLVDRRAIGNAIALNSAQFNLGRVLGPAVAGLLVASVGEASAFWFNALALAVLAWLLRGLHLPAQDFLTRQEAGLWSNLLDGFRYIQSQRVLVALLALGAAPAFFILPSGTLMPLFARDVLSIGAPGLGLLNASIGLGAFAAAITFALRPAEGGNGRLLVVGLVWMAFTLAVFALSRLLAISLIGLVALGASQVAYYTTTNVMVLLLSPARYRGRILSVQTLSALGLMPIGSLAMGALADRIGPHVTLLAGSGLTVVALGLIVIWCPQLWTLRLDPAMPPPSGGTADLGGVKPSPAEVPQEG